MNNAEFDRRFEDILTEAFRIQMNRELDALPTKDVLDKMFPPDIEKRNAIVSKTKSKKPLYMRYTQYAAIILLVILSVCTVSLLQNNDHTSDIPITGALFPADKYTTGRDTSKDGIVLQAGDLLEWLTDTRRDKMGKEVSVIEKLLCDEGYCNPDTGEIDEKNLVTAYLIDTSSLSQAHENDLTFGDLISEDHFYRYYNTETECVTEVMKNRSDEWVVGATSLEIDGYPEKFPDIGYMPEDITKNIQNSYPTLNYNSVRFIYLIEVSHTLVYFTCGDEAYVAYYPLVEIDNGLKAGEIYTADKMLDVLSEYPIYNPIVGGEIGGGVVAKQQDPLPWYIYPAIGISVIVIVGAVGYVIIKRKKAEQ